MFERFLLLLSFISLWTPDSEASPSCDKNIKVSYLNGAIYMVAKAEFKRFLLLLSFISLWTPDSEASPSCDKNIKVSYLNGAIYMVAKAEYDFAGKPRDCSDILLMGHIKSSVYSIWPTSRLLGNKSVEVYCDMKTEGGGWTVIQRRGRFGSARDLFDKDWNSYKKGFGDLMTDFWLGNEYISALTNQILYTARFDVEDELDNTAYAQYDTFWIDDENGKFMLHVDGYNGTAGDALGIYHNNQNFSTKDQDYDSSKGNCAQFFSAGWWYRDCSIANLNALYLVGKGSVKEGMTWSTWKGKGKFLASSEIKIRPKHFKMR